MSTTIQPTNGAAPATPSMLSWGDPGAVQPGYRWLYPGAAPSAPNALELFLAQGFTCIHLAVHVLVPPAAGIVNSFYLCRNALTQVEVKVSAGQSEYYVDCNIRFSPGDRISVVASGEDSGNATGVQVTATYI